MGKITVKTILTICMIFDALYERYKQLYIYIWKTKHAKLKYMQYESLRFVVFDYKDNSS